MHPCLASAIFSSAHRLSKNRKPFIRRGLTPRAPHAQPAQQPSRPGHVSVTSPL